ncbi:MAG: guanylate kinase [Holosporaceae bacterium]|nr:guanylate kinase [Holosporaceae bacterium]
MKKSALFVISGPSAVGKNSVVDEILKIDRSIGRIVTCTTRKIRKSERHGEDYFFMKKSDFLLEIERKNLIEFSEVYGNYYGVMFSSVNEKIKSGEDAILIINFEGFLKIKKVITENVYGMFILPPSIEDLELRMKLRGEDSPKIVARRLSLAREDMAKAKFYDFCFKNFDIITTARDILETINNIRQKQ